MTSKARLGALGSLIVIGLPTAVLSSPAAFGSTPNITQTWSVPMRASAGGSSPIVATLDSGGPVAVVGDESGNIYAVHLSNGSEVAGWPASTGGTGIQAAPSTSGGDVFVGVGLESNPASGGVAAYSATGSRRWISTPAGSQADIAGVAVGDLQGQTDVVSGSLSQYSQGLNAASGTELSGWPFLNADSDFTTPAIADLYDNGANEVIEGGDSTGNPVVKDEWGNTYVNGGHLRVISSTGGAVCEYNTNQVVQSSPAVGEFLSGQQVGIVAGTGAYYQGASQTNQLLAWNSHCGLQWATPLDGETNSSPALVDALGNGQLQVAEGTNTGTVYLLNGATGAVIWHTQALGVIGSSLASVDLGGGYQDIVAATQGGAEILDGRSGQVVWTYQGSGFANTPLITDDPNATIGITLAGSTQIVHFEIAGSKGADATETGSWPMFHHDPQLTGDDGTPVPNPNVKCSAPRGGPAGYWLVGSDGGIFNYGNLPFCGSTGGIALNKPIVGIAGTTDGGGYWMVASDGGIFAFGDARFYGSTGGITLNKPIVAMAASPTGHGYWLVASDGGVFAFGDAKFHGSTGGITLNKPIVGIAATSDGGGYWLVASDGGIFAFGDAKFHGSTGGITLNKPVVGIAPAPLGAGYWIDASDGGIFAFGDATFYGSTGGITLNKPVVGMATDRAENGYWLVAADGGIFNFGHTHFYGSTGGITLNKPIVAIAGY